MTCLVYFISNGRAIKIGHSKQPGQRFRELQCGNESPLEFIGSVAGGADGERFLHRELKQYRLSGEWFVDCPQVRERIAIAIADGIQLPLKKSRASFKGSPEFEARLADSIASVCKYPNDFLERVVAHRRALATERAEIAGMSHADAVASAEAFLREMAAEEK